MALRVPASGVAVPAAGACAAPGDGRSLDASSRTPTARTASTGGAHTRAFPTSASTSVSASSTARQRRHVAGYRRGSDVFLNSDRSSATPSALIDIQDGGDGSVTFKYGAVDDIWHLDSLLENLCRGGVFGARTAESFIRAVIELFMLPVSHTGRRRMVDLLSSYVRHKHKFTAEDLAKTASKAIAVAVAEYLPPSNVGSYSKGSSRPSNRFSAGQDDWWTSIDSFFGVGEASSADDIPEQLFAGLGGYRSTSTSNSKKSDTFDPLRPKFSGVIDESFARFVSRDASNPYLATHSLRGIPMNATGIPALESISGAELEGGISAADIGESISTVEPMSQDYTLGVDFVLHRSRDSEVEEDSIESTVAAAEVAAEPDAHFARPFTDLETLPAASIRDMFEWQQEDSLLSSVESSAKPQAKKSVKRMTQRAPVTRPKAAPGRERASAGRARSSCTRKAKNPARSWRNLLPRDVFFSLPVGHKRSGVAGFLDMRKNFGREMQVILNHASVALGATGLATTLHVGARMLSVNATFDRLKLFIIIRGAALLLLSSIIESLRKAMIHLPARCAVADFGSSHKSQVQCVQLQLRRLSFTMLSVLVFTVVGHSF